MSQILPAKRIPSARGCMLALVLAACLPGVAAACTLAPATGMDPSAGAQQYWVYTNVGEPLMHWGDVWGAVATAPIRLYSACTPGRHQDIHFSPDLAYAGYEVDGAAVFQVGLQLGVQFRIRVNDGRSWGAYQNVGESGIQLRSYPGEVTRDLLVEIQYRYIAVTEPSGSRLYADAFSWIFDNRTDSALSLSRGTLEHHIDKFVPPPAPSCSFTASPPADVPLPEGHAVQLRNPGDSSAPASFSWRFSCNTTAHGAKVIYTPTTNYSGLATGRMEIERGGDAAEGVEIEVRRATSASATKVPVRFGYSYEPGRSGTEYLDARYVRTTGDLKAGTANAGLKIELDAY